MIPIETVPGLFQGEKEVNPNMIYLIYCKNVPKSTMYPHPARQ
jgi:hypothetical protein